MTARIYKPAKTAMQAGTAQTESWLLVHEATAPREIDPLMGWTSSSDTATQVQLEFATKDEAIAYAERNGIAYTVAVEPPVRGSKKSYSDNFKWGRTDNWTH